MFKKKRMLPRYYQLAKNELGIQEVYNDNENLFTFMENINKLIDRTNKTINVNGQDIAIKDYKIYLNNKILQQNNYIVDDSVSIFGIFIGAWVSISLAGLNYRRLNDMSYPLFLELIMIYIVTCTIIILLSRVFRRINYVNNVGFYQLVLDIVNQI